jgi:hypothetical protein
MRRSCRVGGETLRTENLDGAMTTTHTEIPSSLMMYPIP